MSAQNALDRLDAASYRLFGGDWRHRAHRKQTFELKSGGLVVMLSGIPAANIGDSLIVFTLHADGVRELEVHSLDRTSHRGCYIWQLTQPVASDVPHIVTGTPCFSGTTFDVLPRHYMQEITLVADIVTGMTNCGGAYEVQDILKIRKPDSDLAAPMLSTLEEGRHAFHFAGSQEYVRWMRTQIARKDWNAS